MHKPHIAFLGTGLMGMPMARNLLRAGFPLTAWNRTLAKANPLKEQGAILAATPQQTVQTADVIITMLSDGQAVTELLFDQQVANHMQSSACFIDMSSIKPAEARNHAVRLQALGLSYLDAPVSGGTQGATTANLAIMVGGDPATFTFAKPILEAMGRPVSVGTVGAGQLAKLANQTIVAVTIGVVAEAMLLIQRGGADPVAIRQALKGGFADSIILQQHGERMTTGNFMPGGLAKFQLKDLNNVLEEAKHYGLSLPLTEQIQARFKRLVQELDGADKDHSGIYLELLNMNPYPPT